MPSAFSFTIDFYVNGEELPHVDILATLVMPDGVKGKKFLVYNNFKIIKKYNNSNYYALSIGLLSDGVVRWIFL